MSVPRKSTPKRIETNRAPAQSAEEREKQLIALATRRAEEQIRDGSVSAQVLTHYLKLGSTRERLEQERLVRENRLLEEKVESLAAQGRMEELYEEAITAMRSYGGQKPVQTDDYDDEG